MDRSPLTKHYRDKSIVIGTMKLIDIVKILVGKKKFF